MTDQVPEIDENTCVGCGVCEEICPGVFRYNPSLGFALVINPDGADVAAIKEACQACPVHCISCLGTGQEEVRNGSKNSGN